MKYCKDTRPGQQLEAAQRQHADLCKSISAKVVTLHAILLGVGGTCYRAYHESYAHKLVTARRAIENSNTPHNQVLELGASNNPPDPH
eukprot:1082440-Pelagomonas_calceolata.AAC.1